MRSVRLFTHLILTACILVASALAGPAATTYAQDRPDAAPSQPMPPALPFTPDPQKPEPNHPETGEPRADKDGQPPLSPQQGEVERLEDRSDTAALSGKPADELLTQLRRERQPGAAKAIAAAVMADWSNSGSPTVNLLMQWADKAIKDKKNAAALDFLDQAIVLEPDYANGWGHRASLHYSQGNYRKAISDLNHVLAIEPRHFGALEMLANILAETGSDQKALEAWQRYLAIYPADRAAQKTVTELSEKLAGART
ncbi:tetratricopeptide repeat protein [Agrobacterium vitis]|uniref:tetratricopeptide repeat protein n=1 Tax=Agrobacterium vitis TaxID=373 RepID=UPI001F16B1B3|nr:tetratricopeptide repeat protein [Agrobacterium vitis]